MKSNKPIVIIAGPTASGKSSFAIELAKLLNGTIINFDSMQVYSDLSILTARPNENDLSLVPHKLYGFISGSVRCTSIFWRNQAVKEIKKVFSIDRVPILVGGTGLYIKTLIDGITDIPASLTKYTNKAENLYKEIGNKNFHNLVKKIDPIISEKIEINDYQRLIRAYTVWIQTKKTLSEWQKNDSMSKKIYNNFLKIKLVPERKYLRENIKNRFIEMIDAGVIDEVKSISKYDMSLPIMKAHGLREILEYIEGKKQLNTVVEEATNQINQYAKRQDTWFRNKYNSQYDIVDVQKDISDNCSNILSLYHDMYK